MGTSSSILTENGAVEQAIAIEEQANGLWKDDQLEADKADGEHGEI